MKRDERIEQARARGLTIDETSTLLGIDRREVERVWAAMDEALLHDDVAEDLLMQREPGDVTGGRAPLAPHGTHAAYVRHRERGEEACVGCREGERIYQRERARRRRAEVRARRGEDKAA